jgi:hypothetical protein
VLYGRKCNSQVNDPTATAGGSGALHHGVWTTGTSGTAYPQVRTFYEGPLGVGFDFTSRPIPNNAISKFQTAHSGLYAERQRVNPDGGSYQGARFPPPALNGGASRAHIGEGVHSARASLSQFPAGGGVGCDRSAAPG